MSAVAPTVTILWTEDITRDPDFNGTGGVNVTESSRIHDGTYSYSSTADGTASSGDGFIVVVDGSGVLGGEKVTITDGVNTESHYVTYQETAIEKIWIEDTLDNTYASGSTVTFSANNLIECIVKPTTNSSVGHADIELRHFCTDTSIRGAYFGTKGRNGSAQEWGVRQIQITIDNGTATKVMRVRIIDYEDSYDTSGGWTRTLHCLCVGGEGLSIRTAPPTNWADGSNNSNDVLTTILTGAESAEMPSYETRGMYNDIDDANKFIIPAEFDYSSKSVSKFDLIRNIIQYIGNDYGAVAHTKQYQFTITYNDATSHNYGFIDYAHMGADSAHTNHDNGGGSATDNPSYPSSGTVVMLSNTIGSSNNVISVDPSTFDGDRIINKLTLKGKIMSDSWTDYWYGTVDDDTYIKKSAGATLSEETDNAGGGSNVSIKALDNSSAPSIIFDLSVAGPTGVSTFFNYTTIDMAQYTDFAFDIKGDASSTAFRYRLTDSSGNVSFRQRIVGTSWQNFPMSTVASTTNDTGAPYSSLIWYGDVAFDRTDVVKIEFISNSTGYIMIDNFAISGLPLLAVAENSVSQTKWGLRESPEIEEVKINNQFNLVTNAIDKLNRKATAAKQLTVTIPIEPTITAINKIAVTITDLGLSAVDYRVMEVEHICREDGYVTRLILEPLEGSNYASDIGSFDLVKNPFLGMMRYLNNKIVGSQTTGDILLVGGGSSGDYVSRTGDTMSGPLIMDTTDISLYSGGDLKIYSDVGSTLKFDVDGATGNTDIKGTLDVDGQSTIVGLTTTGLIQAGLGITMLGPQKLKTYDGTDIEVYSGFGSGLVFDVDGATGSTTIAGQLNVNNISIFTGTSLNLYSGTDFQIFSDVGSTNKFTIDGATGTMTIASSTKVTNLQADSVDGMHIDGIVKLQGASASTAGGAGVATLTWPSAFSGTPKVQANLNAGSQYIVVLTGINTTQATATVYVLASASTLTSVGTADSGGASHSHSITALGAMAHTLNGSVTGESGHTHTDNFTIVNHAAHTHTVGTYLISSESPTDPHNHTLSGESGTWGAMAHTLNGGVTTSSGHTHTDTFSIVNHAVHDHGALTGAQTASHTHTLSGFGTGNRVTGWTTAGNGILVTAISWE